MASNISLELEMASVSFFSVDQNPVMSDRTPK